MRFPAAFASLFCLLTIGWTGCRGPKLTPEETGTQFFSAIQKGNFSAAYAATTFSFQAQQTAANFESKVRNLHLDQFASVAWERTGATDKNVKLKGVMKLSQGAAFPVRLGLHRQSARWLISELEVEARGDHGTAVPFSVFGQNSTFMLAAADQLPTDAEAKALARETITDFSAGLERGDFAEFYATVAAIWQKQSTAQRFGDSFKKFTAEKIRLLGGDAAVITWTEPPRFGEQGLLQLTGTCATRPEPVKFAFQYSYEVTRWRLFSVNFAVDDQKPPKTAPSASPVAK